MKLQKYFLLFTLFFTQLVFAEIPDTAAVQNAYYTWCKTMGTAKGDAHQIIKFYAPNAILLPTLSSNILINHHGGFDAYFSSLTSHDQFKCTPEELKTQLVGNVAINSGKYAFSYRDAHHHKIIPARFTFVYQKQGKEWLIINHHSSVVPSY